MYIFNKDILLKKTQKDLIEFLKYNTNAEIGGHRIYDGSGTHLVQSPEEIVWLADNSTDHAGYNTLLCKAPVVTDNVSPD